MANLGTLFTFGLAGGAAVVVGKAVGQGDYATAKEYSQTIQLMFLVIGIHHVRRRILAPDPLYLFVWISG